MRHHRVGATLLAATFFLVARTATTEPRVGAPLSAFSVMDLANAWHNPRELIGHRTLVVAITGTNAGTDMGHWFNNARARFGANVPIVGLVALSLSVFAPDA